MRASSWIGFATLVAGSAMGGLGYRSYRREIEAAMARVETGATRIDTAAGRMEYARTGSGEAVLISHGAGGGWDQGLEVGAELFGPGFDIIAPSRFGYLAAPIPEDPCPATQARAYAALLDRLGVERCILFGISAGAPSAIEFALQFPNRTSALILAVPRCWDPADSMHVDATPANRAVIAMMEGAADFAYWAALRVSRSALVRFFGVPPELEASAPRHERERMTRLLRMMMPVSRRAAGINLDGSTSIGQWPLDRIRTPTLVISARDDLFHTLPGAEYTAGQIPGAELLVLDDGGHLMVGHVGQVCAEIQTMLATRETNGARRIRACRPRSKQATSPRLDAEGKHGNVTAAPPSPRGGSGPSSPRRSRARSGVPSHS